jgi:hypothetical protein
MHRAALTLCAVLLALPAVADPAPTPPPRKPRLAFLELSPGPGVQREVAATAGELTVVALSETGKFDVIARTDVKTILGYEAQAQLLGCGEASCMMDLGGALGAAFLVSGSLGKLGGDLQLILSLIDVNHTSVGKRVASSVSGEAALPQALREAVAKLTGEVVPASGPADACSSPPCAREAIAALRRWWEKEWDALTIIGVVPDGPFDQRLVDKAPARIFRTLVRTRSRSGARDEYLAYVQFKKVEGDWYFDQGSMRHLRNLPIVADDPPDEAATRRLLSEGFAAAHQGSKVLKLAADRFPDYERPTKEAPASWSYTFEVTHTKAGKTEVCPRAEGQLVKDGRAWKYLHKRDFNCEEVLDAQKE